MKKITYIFVLLLSSVIAQTPAVKIGDKAPSFLLTLPKNTTKGFSMPYVSRVVLLHFYSTSVPKSSFYNKPFNRLAKRYKNTLYKSAEGFEAIEIAVQSDKNAWMESIAKDTLNEVINGIAMRGFNEDICKKYGINSLPTDIVIDEYGMIIAINPKITVIEDILDSKKNFQPLKNDIVGTLAYSSNRSDFFKYAKMYLFNAYGDSIARTVTDSIGKFTFSEIKLNQDFILKVDNQADFLLSDPIAIYNTRGERVMESTTAERGFVFYIPSNLSSKIIDQTDDVPSDRRLEQFNVSKHLIFKNSGAELGLRDENELKSIIELYEKNKDLFIEVTGHESTKLDPKLADNLSLKKVTTVKNYLIKKGIPPNHVKVFAKGNNEPLIDCRSPQNCADNQHLKNQRIEFRIYKN